MAEEELPDWAKGVGKEEKLPDWAKGIQQEPISWSDVPRKALQNAPHSAMEFGKSVIAPLGDMAEVGARGIDWAAQKFGATPRKAQPMPVTESLADLGKGLLEKAGLKESAGNEKYADAVGKFFVDRYGSVEGVKKTLAEDPVGLMADLSTAFTGGGAGLRAAGLAGTAGGLAKAARLTDPLAAAALAAKPALKLGAGALGFTTGAGTEAVQLAGRAGLEGGEAARSFEQNLRGVAPMEEAVQDARSASQALRNKRNAAYNQEMAQITAATPAGHKLLQLDNIDKALTDTQGIGLFKGRTVDPDAVAAHQKLSAIVDEWRKDPIHTIEDVDKLKQTMGGILKSAEANSREKLVAGKVYDAARKTIIDADPRYAKAMTGYEKSTELLDELDRTLSLNPNATTDTALRKMQSVLRDNVNTSYGYRRKLTQFILDNGAPDLLYKMAGQALRSGSPRGLARLHTAIGAEIAAALGLAVSHTPALGAALAAAPLMSPRIVGEGAFLAGSGASTARPFTKPSFQAGRLPTIEHPSGFKKGGRVTKTFRYCG